MRSILGVVVAVGALGAGCDRGRQCTEISVASVSLEVVAAEDGATLPDAEARFSVDGGPEREPDERREDGTIILDFDETGVFVVTVSAPGYETVMETYEVLLDKDGCHPLGQSDTIALATAG